MEKNNPNRTFRAKHKVAEPAGAMQKGTIKGHAHVLKHPYGVLIGAALGRRIALDDLTYTQAQVVIDYGHDHIRRRSGGRG